MAEPVAFSQDRGDPRPSPSDQVAEEVGQLRPRVAGRAGGAGLWLAVGGAVLLGALVLLFLIGRRHAANDVDAVNTPATIAAPAPPPELALAEAAGRAPAFAPAGPQGPAQPTPAPIPQALFPGPAPVVVGVTSGDGAQHLRAPSLVVDLSADSGASKPGPTPAMSGAPSSAAAGEGGAKAGPSTLSRDEQFSERVGNAEPDHAEATSLRNTKLIIPQGTMIPAVLETAMNSDLPGFVRAVVSRDVRGFDGSSVLVPRGSRLVGQYRSGLSQGASRIFVIWTRVLRPDGASVQIASPGGDPLGRAGQAGKVHSHFFENFSSAILLSVINAEITNLAAQPNTQIVIGGGVGGVGGSLSSTSPGAAAATGGTSALTPPVFPPTITVRQGAPIAIFVARDLDFSTVPGLAK